MCVFTQRLLFLGVKIVFVSHKITGKFGIIDKSSAGSKSFFLFCQEIKLSTYLKYDKTIMYMLNVLQYSGNILYQFDRFIYR